jgi:excisionase family DNA binding protein
MAQAASNSAAVRSAPDAERLISIPTGAEMLNLSQVTIRRYLTQKRLRRFKVGSRTLIKVGDLMGLVKEAK